MKTAIIRACVKAIPAVRELLHGRARWIAGTMVKTFDHYLRQISSRVEDLYNDDMSERDFVDEMSDIIPAQLTKAWNEGMRENGLEPDEMLEEWQDQLDAMIMSEYDYVDNFAADIVKARDVEGLDGMLSRAELWANRYNDVYNEAIIRTADGKTKYIWRRGATEEGCRQCQALDGIVAFSREWEQAGFRPQQPPNSMLECGGWRCDCSLEETDERRTPKALDRLMDIAQGAI